MHWIYLNAFSTFYLHAFGLKTTFEVHIKTFGATLICWCLSAFAKCCRFIFDIRLVQSCSIFTLSFWIFFFYSLSHFLWWRGGGRESKSIFTSFVLYKCPSLSATPPCFLTQFSAFVYLSRLHPNFACGLQFDRAGQIGQDRRFLLNFFVLWGLFSPAHTRGPPAPHLQLRLGSVAVAQW